MSERAALPAGAVAYRVDRDDRLTRVDAALAELAGRPEGELRGAPFGELVAPPDRPRVALARAAAAAGATELRIAASGAWRWAVDRWAPAGDGRVGVLVDVSDAHQAAEGARRRAEVARLARAIGGLVHELGNPAAAVTSNVQLAQRQAPGPDAGESLAAALEECVATQAMLRRLSAFAAQAEGGAEEGVAPQALAETGITLLRRRLREARVAWRVEVPPDLPPVRACGAAPFCALFEVLDNALAALAGRPDAALALGARLDDGDPDVLLLDVDDSGPGLDPAARARACLPFWGSAPDRPGLGLALARDELARLGGGLALSEAPTGGLRVTLGLPFA